VLFVFYFELISDHYLEIFDSLGFAAISLTERLYRKSRDNDLRLVRNRKQTTPLNSAWSITDNLMFLSMILRHLANFGGLRKMSVPPERSKISSSALRRSKENCFSYRITCLKFKIQRKKRSESCLQNVQRTFILLVQYQPMRFSHKTTCPSVFFLFVKTATR
jgi:hypothetical protein